MLKEPFSPFRWGRRCRLPRSHLSISRASETQEPSRQANGQQTPRARLRSAGRTPRILEVQRIAGNASLIGPSHARGKDDVLNLTGVESINCAIGRPHLQISSNFVQTEEEVIVNLYLS